MRYAALILILLAAIAGLIAWWKMRSRGAGTPGWLKEVAIISLIVFVVMASYMWLVPRPSPPLPYIEPLDPIAEVAAQLDWGPGVLAAPDEMQVQTVDKAVFSVSRSSTLEQLQKEIEERLGGVNVQIVAEAKVELSDRMQAHLSGAGFEITPITPEVQAVLPNKKTIWEWQIEPQETGEQSLYLSLAALMEVNGRDTADTVETYSAEITILVDWFDLLWKSTVAVLGIIVVAIITGVGQDLYTSLKGMIQRADPEPKAVGRKYQPKDYAADSLVWVNEIYVEDKLTEGYSHYLDPSDGARRYRISNPSDPIPQKEFYMLKPNAKNLGDTGQLAAPADEQSVDQQDE